MEETPEEKLEFERAVAALQHAQEKAAAASHQDGGLIGKVEDAAHQAGETFKATRKAGERFVAWANAKYETCARRVRWLAPIAKIGLAAAVWAAPILIEAGQWTLTHATTYKGKDKKRHFSWKRTSCSVLTVAGLVWASPYIAGAAYYYGSAREMDNVYLPDTAVFFNQQLPGSGDPHIVTHTDERHTIMGRCVHKDGFVEPLSLDVDTNTYFLFTTYNPRKIAAKLNSQSPFGMKADLKVTGWYMLLPRAWRVGLGSRFNARVEIVDVIRTTELEALPDIFKGTFDGSYHRVKEDVPPQAAPSHQTKVGTSPQAALAQRIDVVPTLVPASTPVPVATPTPASTPAPQRPSPTPQATPAVAPNANANPPVLQQ